MDENGQKINHIPDTKKIRDKIASIPERIIVEGTRGKSSTVILLEEGIRREKKHTLAKTTGEEPLLIHNGKTIPIIREKKNLLLDYDNIPPLLECDYDSLIMENQAITPYTMQYVHKLVQPQHIIIPNIRIDHTEGLGFRLAEMVENFVKNVRVTPGTKQVYYAESINKVHDLVLPILDNGERKYPHLMHLHDVVIPQEYRNLPGIENIAVTSYFLEHQYGSKADITEYAEEAKKKLAVRTGRGGTRYVNAAKVNDPISFVHIMRYVMSQTTENVVLVGYLRPDRPGRIDIFEDFFEEIAQKFGDRIEKIHIAGYATPHLYKKIPAALREKTDINVTESDIEQICRYSEEHNCILMTMINRVNPFMDTLIQRIENGPDTGDGD